MLKKAINFMLSFLVILLACFFVPKHVMVSGIIIVFFATVLYYLAKEILTGCYILLFFLSDHITGFKPIADVIVGTLIIIASPLELYIAQKFCSGFEVHGIITYILLGLALLFTQLPEKKTEK